MEATTELKTLSIEQIITDKDHQIDVLKLQVLSQQQTIKLLQQQINSLKNNIKHQELGQAPIIPDPVAYKRIQFDDGPQHISYTDCWEISVLRFLHLVFGHNGTMQMDKLKKLMTKSKQCKELIDYFHQNPTFNMSKDYYVTQEGMKIRSEWCQFLNKPQILNLKHGGKYQVKATLQNLLSFFKTFFPNLNITLSKQLTMNFQSILTKTMFNAYEVVLQDIYKQLSCDFDISIKMQSNVIYDRKMKDYMFFSSIQHIYLNGRHMLDWEIYEDYNIDMPQKEIGERLSGHSDLRYP